MLVGIVLSPLILVVSRPPCADPLWPSDWSIYNAVLFAFAWLVLGFLITILCGAFGSWMFGAGSGGRPN